MNYRNERKIIMIQRVFHELSVSGLGMGCMRFPLVNGNNAVVDEVAAGEMICTLMEEGVNYYDTAWGYHEGNAEAVMGRLLSPFPRDSYFLASKFPGYDLNNMGKVEEIFEEQLRRCQVNHFDFYLFHNVCEANIDHYLDPQYGILDYLLKQKQAGRIRHLGFSTHGSIPVMERFLDAWGEHIEFCQIQLNWFDWLFQKADQKVELLNKRNLPIWVMEPLRGGKLANLPEEFMAKLEAVAPGRTAAEWGMRFLQGVPGVTVVLSGMSNMAQISSNISTFSQLQPLPEDELTVLMEVAKEMAAKTSVPCTACRYCTTHCPMELDIPRLLELYNEFLYSGRTVLPALMISALEENKRPASCIGCRSCEAVCPQEIKISEALANLNKQVK